MPHLFLGSLTVQLILYSPPYLASYYGRLSSRIFLPIKTIDPYVKGIEEDFMDVTF